MYFKKLITLILFCYLFLFSSIGASIELNEFFTFDIDSFQNSQDPSSKEFIGKKYHFGYNETLYFVALEGSGKTNFLALKGSKVLMIFDDYFAHDVFKALHFYLFDDLPSDKKIIYKKDVNSLFSALLVKEADVVIMVSRTPPKSLVKMDKKVNNLITLLSVKESSLNKLEGTPFIKKNISAKDIHWINKEKDVLSVETLRIRLDLETPSLYENTYRKIIKPITTEY